MYTLKKSLGQHFLKDESVCRAIVQALQAFPLERLLEVGPGGGALTKHLLQLEGTDFKAVEIDDEKVAYLKAQYPALQDKIIHKSVLDMEEPFTAPYTVVGNFPYNISTEIVFRIIEWRASILGMVGMFQKEVAQRLAAPSGSKVYGVTSVLTQAFFDVQYLFDVPPEAFNPPPKVVSGVLSMRPRKTPLQVASEKKFVLLVKSAFNQRRKTLRNAVKPYFTTEKLGDDIFNKRAEQLSVADFAALTFRMA
jgi:16S rRNA (adenine1518-N6/adenine1519-N6)-dimethyltransferase